MSILRQCSKDDAGILSRQGIADGEDREVYVLERNGAVAGALAASAKPFESEWLEKNVYQVDSLKAWDDSSDLEMIAREGIGRLRDKGANLVTCRRSEQDRSEIEALQHAGMVVVECLLTLSHPLDEAQNLSTGVDEATRDDAEGVGEVAARAFRFDRFHADPNVDDVKADALKAAWARNSVLGRADRVFVTRDGERITGFNSCLLKEDRKSVV